MRLARVRVANPPRDTKEHEETSFVRVSSCPFADRQYATMPHRKQFRASRQETRKEIAVINKPRIQIHYCTQCRWLLRAAWYAQELLTTFETELGEVALAPGVGGIFAVYVDAVLIWSRAEQGRFPDIKELKQLVRDQVAPERNLGHTDRQRPNEP